MSDTIPKRLPLDGLAVLEMGSSIAGPFAGRVFSDFGATVWKVEPPEIGDAARGWGSARIGGTGTAFQAFNKEKRSITVDFTSPDELDRLRRFVAEKIDVVVQNLRPGVVEKFGLDAATLMAGNPTLIYCNMGAFGPVGPLKKAPGYDPLIQAFSGIADATGDVGGEAVRVGVPLIDIGTGMWAAIGILTALQQRNTTGRGCLVDAAMFETALAWQSMTFANYEGGAGWPERMGLQGPMVMPNDGYETADGKLMLTTGTPLQFARFCSVIERPDLLDDPRFATNNARIANSAAFKVTINETLSKRTRAEWNVLLSAVDVPNAPIQSLGEAIKHPQTIASGIMQDSPDGSFRLFAMPLRFDGERPGFRRPAPELGEATQEAFAFMTE
ncbi:MAG: CoA transferase [Alphaproteobacteria bacterium]|nr:CoA transferase [Alphaproteobacteria bacterium]